MRRVNWSMTMSTQEVRKVNDSQRNKSTLHKLSFICPSKVSHDGPPDPDSGRKCIAKMRRTTSLSISTPKASVICSAIRGQPQLGLRRFISTTASMSSLAGPFGPARRPENDRGSHNPCRTHEKGAQTGDNPIRNAEVGSSFPTAIQNQQLMSHQRRFSNDGPESTRPCKSQYGDDHMNEKVEDVAHGGWYQTSKPPNSAQSGNSPSTGSRGRGL